MNMSMHCKAVKPADDNYLRKAAAYRACEAAGVRVPQELIDFFDGDGGIGQPDPAGTTVDLANLGNLPGLHESCELYESDGRQGFQVDVTRLPEGTRFVRFYCSW